MTHSVVVARALYAETTRPVIDGRTRGFCKLVADRDTRRILGCHVVGERAVEVAQMAAIAMTAGMKLDDLAPHPALVSNLRQRPRARGAARRSRTPSGRAVAARRAASRPRVWADR